MDGTNRDGSLTEVLTCEQQRMLEQAVLNATREEAQDVRVSRRACHLGTNPHRWAGALIRGMPAHCFERRIADALFLPNEGC